MPFALRAVILWLHLGAAITWIGGLMFQVLVVFPVLGRGAVTPERLRFSLSLEGRFRAIMWPAVGVVLFTGLVNLMNIWHATSVAGGTFPPMFASVLSVKLLLVLGMIALQAVLQLIVQPRRLAALGAWVPGSQELPSALVHLQRLALGLYALLLGLALGVVWCAIVLRAA
jgi:putative copper resistance protein D